MLYKQSRKKSLIANPNVKITLMTMRDNSRQLRELIRSTLNRTDVTIPFDVRFELNKSISYLDDVHYLLNRLKDEIK